MKANQGQSKWQRHKMNPHRNNPFLLVPVVSGSGKRQWLVLSLKKAEKQQKNLFFVYWNGRRVLLVRAKGEACNRRSLPDDFCNRMVVYPEGLILLHQ